jgi:hypothetical protein
MNEFPRASQLRISFSSLIVANQALIYILRLANVEARILLTLKDIDEMHSSRYSNKFDPATFPTVGRDALNQLSYEPGSSNKTMTI